MVLRALRRLTGAGRKFARDKRGSITVDFVISMPILLGVLVLTTEYGRVLQARTVLDNAVSDATRYLARVPQDNGVFQARSLTIANGLIEDRLDVAELIIEGPVIQQIDGQDWISMRGTALVEVPALSLLNLLTANEMTLADGTPISDVNLFPIDSVHTFRHFGR